MSETLPARFDPLLRRRVRVELATLAALTPLFLLLVPPYMPVYAAAGALFAGYVLRTRHDTERQIWRRLRARVGAESGRGLLAGFTGVMLLLCWGWSRWRGVEVHYPHLGLAMLAYLPWAALQQMLFLFYFLGRLRVVLPRFTVPALAGLHGLAFGLVHLPHWPLAGAAGSAAAVWAFAYLRGAPLWAVAGSHAVLGAAFYYMVLGRDLLSAWPL